MELDLHQLIRIFRRRWWIILLLTSVAASSAFFASSRQTPLYEATAVLVINPGALVGSNEYSSLQDSQRLAATYVQLINTQPVRDRVKTSLELEDIDPDRVSTSILRDSLLIEITVTDESPEQAAIMADAFVLQFQGYISDQNESRISQSRSAVDEQIDFLNTQIAEIDGQISAAGDGDVSALLEQRQALVGMISQLESDAARSQMQAASSSAFIEMVDPAPIPESPSSPQIVRNTALGAIVGIMLAVGVIALLEYLDNTVKEHTNIQEVTHAPLLSSIPVNTGIERGSRQVYTIADTKSGSAEAISLLRTNLTFAGINAPISSIAITSSLAGEGKSTVAANLAVAFAKGGKTVAIIDADLRKPTQHRIFGVENHFGVTNYVTDPTATWESLSHRVALPGLTLIPSGPIPPNPAEMVASPRFRQLVEMLEAQFDIVIIDNPPLLQASDGLVLGSFTDGILLVTQFGKTRVDALKSAAALVNQSGTRLVGVVVNRASSNVSSYYGGYYGTYES